MTWVLAVLLFLSVVYGFLSRGPWSLRAEFDREVARSLSRTVRPAALVRAYRHFGKRWLMSHGEGVWYAPAGEYTYLRFDLDSIEYNVGSFSSS